MGFQKDSVKSLFLCDRKWHPTGLWKFCSLFNVTLQEFPQPLQVVG